MGVNRYIFLILLISIVTSAQVFNPKQEQYSRHKNKLVNPGFEADKSYWSNVGGVFGATSTMSNIRSGLRAGFFDASGTTQFVIGAFNTLPAGLNEVSGWFKTSATDYVFSLYSGTLDVISKTIPASTEYQKLTLEYTLATAADLRPKITSASNASVIYFDDFYGGETSNIISSNFSSDWTSFTPSTNVTTNTTTSGKWSRTNDSMNLVMGIDWSGAPSSFVTLEMDIPSGKTFDTNKLLSTTTLKEKACFGTLHDPAGGTTSYSVKGSIVDTNTIRFRFLNDIGSLSYENADIGNTFPFSIGNGSYLRVVCNNLPISGWSSQDIYALTPSVLHRAEVSSTGTVSSENVDWVNGNCSNSSSVYTCTLNTSYFSATPICMAQISGTTPGEITITPASSTSVVVRTFNGTLGTAADRSFSLFCYGDR